jgi:hypothetical protein
MILRCTAALLAAALLLVSCGGGGTDRTKAQVRLVNASSGYAQLDLNVHGTLRQGGVGYGGTDGYVEVDPGDADTTINSAGSATALLSFTPVLSKNRYYSILAWGTAGALSQLLLDENANQPDTGKALLTVFNAATSAGALDVYLTGSSDALATSVAVQAGAAAGSQGVALTVNSGTYRLRITAPNSKTDVRLDLPSFGLSSKQVATLVLTPGRGGVMVNALLVTQQSAITRLDATQARVRVAAGMADGGSVSAAVGGTTLLSAVGSPAVGAYTLVTAGTPAVVAAVNGTALATTPPTLVAGGDYTLLVYGPLAGPLSRWIEDDNSPPTDSTQVRLRLVNAVGGLAAPLALTDDFLPVADSVASGFASGYAQVANSTTAQLSVTAAGVATPLYSANTQTLLAGATYSVFMLGSSTAPVGVLRRDR